MALNATALKGAIKAAIDGIDVDSGEITNDDVIQALATGIIDHITSNAQVVVAGGSSAGTYSVT